jgi:CRISPR/Cas system-associated exonuclease Cas4 (RecB family)
MRKIFVINSRGEREPFSFKKVYQSARKVGASKRTAKDIAEKISFSIKEGESTQKIAELVNKMLSQEIPQAALKFRLKNAMKKMGPTGFPFEKYVAEIFSREGYKVKLNQYIQGACLKYEIDFTAQKEGVFYIAECKFRNLPNTLVHANDILVTHARFLDIKRGSFLKGENRKMKALLATNTKFTSRTVKYSKCYNIELLGWKCPKGRGLESLIDNRKLYPITILPSLDRKLEEVFASKKMMLAEDVLSVNLTKISREFDIPAKKLDKLASEASLLLNR